MTDADTQLANSSGVATVLAETGLQVDSSIDGAERLNDVPGPFLTADVVDEAGVIVATVAVFDDPDTEPDAMLQRLCQSAVADMGPGSATQEAEPILGAFELAQRFTGPFEVEAFTDGAEVKALFLHSADRRGGQSNGGSATGGATAGSVGGSPSASATAGSGGGSLAKLVNVSLDVSVELGRTRLTLADVMALDVGSVVELDRAAGAPVDIRVNETLLAQGEVVLIDDEYAVRITAIVDTSGPT